MAGLKHVETTISSQPPVLTFARTRLPTWGDLVRWSSWRRSGRGESHDEDLDDPGVFLLEAEHLLLVTSNFCEVSLRKVPLILRGPRSFTVGSELTIVVVVGPLLAWPQHEAHPGVPGPMG